MARPKNTHLRRAQIVDGLLEVMSSKSYESATIPEIARAAKLRPGLVHYHFATKHEILLALVERLAATLEARAKNLGEEGLHAFLRAALELGDDADPRAVAAWNLIAAEAIRDPEVQEIYAATLRRTLADLRRHVRARLRAEGRDERGATKIAAAALSAIEGAYRVASSAPGVLPRGWALPAITALVDAMIAQVGARAGLRAR